MEPTPHSTPAVAAKAAVDESLPPWLPAVTGIVEQRLWCVMEVCADVSAQSWEPRLIICERDAADSAISIAEAIKDYPESDLRIAGYTRDTLCRVEQAPTALCHIALRSGGAAEPGPPEEGRRRDGQGCTVTSGAMPPAPSGSAGPASAGSGASAPLWWRVLAGALSLLRAEPR
jgi:hypothetical protein